ncbi:PDZ domain-containing protein [Trichostrongylus colubriformis]|uniref:PDZ domain-containing protein n=1 Tax=Trichostrongylus colubriformis TaxID=6319 RepID=A0AAN8FAV3_TRICO
MNQGAGGNRRQSRSRTRRCDVWTRFPRWNPHRTNQESAHAHGTDEECQLCTNPRLCPKAAGMVKRSYSASSAREDSQGAVFYGPWPRPTKARSQSTERGRYRRPAPVEDEHVGPKLPRTPKPKCNRKSWADVARGHDSSGSSSGPEPMSSPTLSHVSSTLSSESIAELFQFDSEIFAQSPAKAVSAEKKQNEGLSAEKKQNEGVVALRNPNTVAICAPPKMITKMPAKIAIGIPSLRGTFGTVITSRPPIDVQDMMEKLKNIAANSQTSEPASTPKEIGCCTKDVTTKPPQNQEPLKPLPPAQTDPVTEAVPKPCTTITRSQSQKPVAPSKATPSSKDLLSDIGNATECSPIAVAARKLKFCCQLAHGSPTAIISNFTSVDELFQSIADCFNISPDDIIFCTINTFKPDMNKLFAGTLEYSDMLFAHVKGQAVEVELTKSEALFGLTVSDNGRCRSFIKRMKDNSIASRARPALAIGQLIEKIDGINVTGMRHYEVVRILRNMPVGKTFTLRVVSPKQSGFQQIAPRSLTTHKQSINDGMRTLRFKANGGVVIEEGAVDKVMIDRLNDILDSYLGVQDDQMAQALWDLAMTCETLPQMNKAVRESELSVFDFPEELVFDMWGVVGDWRRSQATKTKSKKAQDDVDLLEDNEEQPLLPLF